MKYQSRFKKWLTSTKAKRVFSFCRWLHIYISTALFALLIFFCFTGITLNHPEWTGESVSSHEQLPLPSFLIKQANNSAEIPIKAVQAYIEELLNVSSPKNIDVIPDFNEITYDYPVPAGYVFVTVSIEDEFIEVERKSGSFLGVINDLHKGRYSGELWKGLIDISAVFILLFSFTGLFILLQSAKHRRQGAYVLILGSLTPVVIYWFFVPQV